MKVILTNEVEKLGVANDVVEVADGYARNFLMPRSLAMPATKSAMANLDNLKRVEERRQVRLRGAAQEQEKQLVGKLLKIEAKVGNEFRLYGSIGTQDIAKAIQEQLGVEVDRKQIDLDESIRSAGFYEVPLKLHRDVTPTLRVQVGDDASASAAEEAERKIREAQAAADAQAAAEAAAKAEADAKADAEVRAKSAARTKAEADAKAAEDAKKAAANGDGAEATEAPAAETEAEVVA